MGIPAFLVASTMNASVAQRLIRLLCPHCKKEINAKELSVTPEIMNILSGNTICEPVGCEECYFTGYKGRKAIYEVIPVDQTLNDFIQNNEKQIQKELQSKRILTIRDNAITLLLNHETSFSEIYPLLINS